MSRRLLADTGPLYAAVDPDDQYHAVAQAELSRCETDETEVVVTVPILLETYTLIVRRLPLPTAHRWLNEVVVGGQLINPVTEDYLAAVQLVRSYDDQQLTLFDGVLAVISEKSGMPIWTYDHHFDIVGAEVWRP